MGKSKETVPAWKTGNGSFVPGFHENASVPFSSPGGTGPETVARALDEAEARLARMSNE